MVFHGDKMRYTAIMVVWVSWNDHEMSQYSLISMDWFKGKSKPETIDFPVKYVFFPVKISLKPIHWLFQFVSMIYPE